MLVYFAIILTVLLGFCGLAIDTGHMELRQNQLQAAADAGALAAAGELWHGGTGSNYQTAANNDVAAYETANNISSTGNPTTQIGAAYGPYTGDHSTVQVTVTQSFPTVFLGLLTHATSSITLTARAVAQMPPCMIFLGNPTLNSTYDYWIASAGNQPVPNYACPEYFKDGLVIDGFAHIAASQVRTSGTGSASVISGGTSWPVSYSVPVIADPLAYITAPTPGPCTNASPISKLNQSTGTTITLTPGTYCGKTTSTPTYTPGPIGCLGSIASTTTPAVDIEGTYVTPVGGVGCPTQGSPNGGNCTSNPTVSFTPGLYIFIGGVNFNCVTTTGTGATLYFTKSSTVGFGKVQMTSTLWDANAPNDASAGGIPGLAIMSDRAWSGGAQDFQWMYSTWYADGVIYANGTGIYGYAFGLSAPNYVNLVAANMYTYDVTISPAVNYANLPAGNPLHTTVSLVQ